MSTSSAEPIRAAKLSALILSFSGGARFLMRAPLRISYALRWEEAGRVNGDRENSIGRRSTARLKEDLRLLEDRGLILRHPGYIEILNYEELRALAKEMKDEGIDNQVGPKTDEVSRRVEP